MPINFGTTPDAKELNFKPTTSGRVSDTTWYLLFEHVALWSSYYYVVASFNLIASVGILQSCAFLRRVSGPK